VSAGSNDVLTVDNLIVGYGERIVLDGVSLSVPRGGCVGLVGESGSGKSTLARAILGLQKPRSGLIHVASGGADHPVQMVFQDPISSLNPHRSAIDELLARVGLDPARFADARPATLSGGQAQRVAIARALVARPALLLCDEPVSSLDVSVQARVLNLLADLREETGLSLLVISHDLAVVRMIADSVSVLCEGRIVESGDTERVISNPKHPYTRELLEAAPRLPYLKENR
jgi:ABC-type glutathione transport system ATPase component